MTTTYMTLNDKITILARLVREGKVKATRETSTVYPDCYLLKKESMGDGEGIFVCRKDGKSRRTSDDDLYVIVSNGVEILHPAGAIYELYDAIADVSGVHKALDAFLANS